MLLFGLTVLVAGLGLFAAVLGPTTAYFPGLFAAYALMGIGAGTSFMTLMTLALADVPAEDAGIASGLVNVSVQISAALGLAVLGTIAAGQTGRLSDRGETAIQALSGGYQLAFVVGGGVRSQSRCWSRRCGSAGRRSASRRSCAPRRNRPRGRRRVGGDPGDPGRRPQRGDGDSHLLDRAGELVEGGRVALGGRRGDRAGLLHLLVDAVQDACQLIGHGLAVPACASLTLAHATAAARRSRRLPVGSPTALVGLSTMIFTTKAEYGVRLLVELGRQAEHARPVSLKAIAEARGASPGLPRAHRRAAAQGRARRVARAVRTAATACRARPRTSAWTRRSSPSRARSPR